MSSRITSTVVVIVAFAAAWGIAGVGHAGPYPANLLAYWPLDEGSGSTTAVDATGNGHDAAVGTSVQASLGQPGMIGSSCALPGYGSAADYATYGFSVSNVTGLYGGSSFSANIWINSSDGLDQGNEMDFIQSDSYNLEMSSTEWHSFNGIIAGVGATNSTFGSGSSGFYRLQNNTPPAPVFTVGAWNLLSMTYKYANGAGTVTTYMNGVQVSTATTNATTTNAFNELSFGCGNSSAAQHALSIDDASLWSDALSAMQLLAMYNTPKFGGALADYGAGNMSALFDLYSAGTGSTTMGNLTWGYITGLSSHNAGDIWSDGSRYYVQLGADGSGVATLPARHAGDANGDGAVDILDLNKLLTNFDKSGMTWSQGDFDGNGVVDILDLNKVLTNFDKTFRASAAGITAIPEPGTLALLAAGLAGLLAYATRKRRALPIAKSAPEGRGDEQPTKRILRGAYE
jgi:hypothetical protein